MQAQKERVCSDTQAVMTACLVVTSCMHPPLAMVMDLNLTKELPASFGSNQHQDVFSAQQPSNNKQC